MNIEVIWWLDRGHDVPMDIIRHIMTDWIYYPPIETNEQFYENISLWFCNYEIDLYAKQIEIIDEEESVDSETNAIIGEIMKSRNTMIKKYGHISDWNTKNITDMGYAFAYQDNFNEDLSHWNVSNVTRMSKMFYKSYSFDCDVSRWNVSQLRDASYLFSDCHMFSCDISNWNVERINNFTNIFENCYLLQEILPTIEQQWSRINPQLSNISKK